jgi:hypothetical protein
MRPAGCLLTAVVVLAGLAVAGDRIAEEIVENRLAEEAQGELGVRPEVEIAGFPFLTQLASRRLGEVEVSAASVEEQGVEVEDVRLRLRGVEIESLNRARVETATGTGVVSFQTLQAAAKQAGIELGRAGDQLRATGPVTVLGQEVTVTALGSISVRDNVIMFAPSEFSAGGVPKQVTDAIGDAVGASWNIRLAVGGLPAGVRLDRVRLVDDGVEVQLSGANLVIAS